MLKLDIISIYDRIRNKWDSKIGLFFSSLLLLIGYRFLIKEIIDISKYKDYQSIIYFIIPLILLIIFIFIWVLTTNRFFLRFNNEKITAGIILIVEDEEEKLIISKILRKVIQHTNETNKSSNLDLKILPSNFCVTNSETEKYLKNFSFMYDVLIRIKIHGGKYDSIEKIIIERFSITFKPKDGNKKKRVFFDTVDLDKDMNLFVSSKDWVYTLNNSGVDKKKYFENIHHIILYYIGFYSIYMDRYEDSLNIISPIYNPQKTIIPISKKEGNKIKFVLQPYNVSEGRLSVILFDLFFRNAVYYYENSDIEKGLLYLKELDALIKSHPHKFEQYITMSRFLYELGDLNQAKLYTQKAKDINSNREDIFLNYGFFSILDNDIEGFCENYLNLFKSSSKTRQNWVDILDFQIKRRNEITNRDEYFNFSTSFIEFVYMGSINRGDFIKMFLVYKELDGYECLYKLGNIIVSNRIKTQISQRKKKRRKKRKK